MVPPFGFASEGASASSFFQTSVFRFCVAYRKPSAPSRLSEFGQPLWVTCGGPRSPSRLNGAWYPSWGLKLLGSQSVPFSPRWLLSPSFGERLVGPSSPSEGQKKRLVPPLGLELLGSQSVPSSPVWLLSPPLGYLVGGLRSPSRLSGAWCPPLGLRVGRGSLGPSRPSEGLRLLFLGNI